MAELSRRKLFGYTNVNIISVDLFTRFSRLITVARNQELETIIMELEKKYRSHGSMGLRWVIREALRTWRLVLRDWRRSLWRWCWIVWVLLRGEGVVA